MKDFPHRKAIVAFTNAVHGASFPQAASGALRAQALSVALGAELEHLTAVFNATSGDGSPLLFGIDKHGGVVIAGVTLAEPDEVRLGDDQAHAAWLGPLRDVTLRRARRCDTDAEDAYVTRIWLEHPRLPAESVEFAFSAPAPQKAADELFVALRELIVKT